MPGTPGGVRERVVDGRWEVQNTKLGEGQFGKVYLGLDRKNNTKIAVKLINMNRLKRDHLERLKGETDILRQITHPNIVKLYDQLNNEKYQLLMLEYMEGKDMYKCKVMVKGQPMAHDLLMLFFGDLASGLHELHHRKIIHRDLKPQNLLLTSTDPRNSTLKIADFGFARVLGGCEDMAQTIAGSPLYMAPEVLEAAVGHTNSRGYNSKADLYSAGVILYEMASGHPPYQGKSQFQLLQEMKANRRKRLEHPDPDLKHLVDVLLQPDPARRIDGDKFFDNTWVLRCIYARAGRQAALAAATAALGVLVGACKLPELGEKKASAQWVLLTEKLVGARRVGGIAAHMNPITPAAAVALYMKAATLAEAAWQILHVERRALLAVVAEPQWAAARQELQDLFVTCAHHVEVLLQAARDGDADETAGFEPADCVIFKHAQELCLRATVEETLQNREKAEGMYREAQELMKIVAGDATSFVDAFQKRTALRCFDMISKRIKKTSLSAAGPSYG